MRVYTLACGCKFTVPVENGGGRPDHPPEFRFCRSHTLRGEDAANAERQAIAAQLEMRQRVAAAVSRAWADDPPRSLAELLHTIQTVPVE